MQVFIDDMGWGEVVGYEDFSGVGDCVECDTQPDHYEWRYIVNFANRDINLYVFQSQVSDFRL